MSVNVDPLLAQSASSPLSRELMTTGRWVPKLQGETLLVVCLMVFVGAAFFVWAFFFRKRRPSDPHRRVIQAGATAQDGDPAHSHSHHGQRHRRHRRRHRHSGHNHRNPTLQETGGLPPPRPDGQLPAA